MTKSKGIVASWNAIMKQTHHESNDPFPLHQSEHASLKSAGLGPSKMKQKSVWLYWPPQKANVRPHLWQETYAGLQTKERPSGATRCGYVYGHTPPRQACHRDHKPDGLQLSKGTKLNKNGLGSMSPRSHSYPTCIGQLCGFASDSN